MKLTLPRIGDEYNAEQMRELVRRLEREFRNVVEDQRRGAITVTADYTLVKEDSLVLVAPAAGGTVTVTVPEVAQWMIDQKWGWTVKLTDTGTLNLVPTTSTIEGTTGVTTSTVNTSLAIQATLDGWKIV